jgi:hypothetical protein
MELEIRDSLKALPKPDDLKPRLVFGELENDDDGKLNPKLDLLNNQVRKEPVAYFQDLNFYFYSFVFSSVVDDSNLHCRQLS